MRLKAKRKSKNLRSGAGGVLIGIFGTFAIRCGSTPVELPSRKARAVVAYLVLQDAHEAQRETLIGLLWSGVSEEKGRSSLRQSLHEIQATFAAAGMPEIVADKESLRLPTDRISIDIDEAISLAAGGTPHPALFSQQRLTETLLGDLESVDPMFREWLLGKRQLLHERLLSELEASSSRLPRGEQRLNICRAILNLDPTHEEAARQVMRHRAAAGDIGGALRVYKNLWDLLETDYDVEPSIETQELVAAIKLGRPMAVAEMECPRTILVANGEANQNDLQDGVRAFGGRVTPNGKSSFLLEFPDPQQAVRAALDLSKPGASASPGSLQVGCSTVAKDDRPGAAKKAAEALATMAIPGQILVSGELRDLLTDDLDVRIVDTNTSAQKAAGERLRIFSLGPPDSTRPLSAPGYGAIQPAIAVIPFESRSQRKDHLLLGDILADEFLSRLSTAKEFTVISRLSSRALRGRSATLGEIYGSLGAHYVVSGTFSVLHREIEGSVELADTRTRQMIWQRAFKQNLQDMMRGLTEPLADLVAMVGASVFAHELQAVKSQPLNSLDNYSLLIAAINLSHRTSKDSFAQARSLLDLLVERLPTHPLPLAWLAKWHVFKINQGWSQDVAKDGQAALGYAARSIDAEPTCSTALTVDAWASLSLHRQFDVAKVKFDQALEANPSDSIAWLLRGTMSAFQGEGDAAIAAAERAIRLSPLDPRRSYYDSLAATAYLSAGRFEQAIALAQRSLRVDRSHVSTLRALAIAQSLSGRQEEAKKTVTEVLQLDPTLTVKRYLTRHPAADFDIGKLWARTLGAAGVPNR
jgi:adenylate cyclase